VYKLIPLKIRNQSYLIAVAEKNLVIINPENGEVLKKLELNFEPSGVYEGQNSAEIIYRDANNDEIIHRVNIENILFEA
jgi:phosphosulfolactate synthase (CoM biosynthesis protein A)